MRPKLWLGLLLALASLWACGGDAASSATQATGAPTALTEKVASPDLQPSRGERQSASSPGFPSRRSFDQHYQKHGAEFRRISQSEYLSLAQTLRDKPVGGPVLEIVRADGVVTRFDRTTGHFGAYNPDRTIRTFFIPNDGERYFHRQAGRPH